MSAAFDAREAAVLAHAVEDWAGTYASTIGDPVRYIADGHLDVIVDAHGRDAVWDAVAAHIAAHPEVLELPAYGDGGREARQAARAAHAGQLMAEAKAAFDAGDADRALALVDEAEGVEPTHVPAPGVSFARVREAIAERAAR